MGSIADKPQSNEEQSQSHQEHTVMATEGKGKYRVQYAALQEDFLEYSCLE